ncbi:hypothetical protein [Arcicella lustrica]|uniref:Outer membrane protein beta-barrel domain-containing protein n=1 Tax=Arcicella lustrica TaxID=2984196 RepID=A0ABU5SD08_9BACT|nr:hypothetical protein [Arcicella sp. DC25W]MEA5425152.1 hypothetical protein [Arcicella sp. DC25W]
MKLTFIPTLCICLFLTFFANGQSLNKNQIGVELAGNNILYSLYYQHNIPVQKHYLGLKLGVTPYFPGYSSAINGEVNTTLGNTNRWFVGAGYSRIKFDEDHFKSGGVKAENDIPLEMLMPQIGYQVLTSNQQNFWRFSMIVPIQVSSKGSTELVVPVWGSISFGWIFN